MSSDQDEELGGMGDRAKLSYLQEETKPGQGEIKS